MQVTNAQNPGRTGRDGYMATLDGWRGIAILLVIVGHAMDGILGSLTWVDEAGAGQIRYIGIHGVLIFFGLSGFLITSRLLDEEQRHARVSLWQFYLRRAFRILPATLFFMAVMGWLAVGGVLDISVGRWLGTLLFAANYSTADYSWYLGHFWSLAVEEHFYMFWPLLFLCLPRQRLACAVSMACAVAVWRAVDFKYQLSGSTAAVFMGRTDIRADHLLWGCAVALAYARPQWQALWQAVLCLRVARWLMGGGFLLLLWAGTYPLDWKWKFLLLSLEGMLVPLLILSTYLAHGSHLSRWLESAPMRVLGRLSFSLYLWQQLFFVWADYQVPALAPWQQFPFNVIALGVLSALSFYLVEQPAIALGRKVLARWPRANLPALARQTSPTRSEP